MNKVYAPILALLFLCAGRLYCIDHIDGSPWNLELSGTVHAASNSNVFYDEEDPVSDTVIHLIPGIRVEYEKLDNVLFEGELILDSHSYLENSDADIVETTLHLQAKPVRSGAYLVFSEDFSIVQNYSAAGGPVETTANYLNIGGGYRGYHLDVSGKAVFESTSYSEYTDLDYTVTGIEGDIEYLFESFYILGGIESGALSYRGDQLNDGNRFSMFAGAGKRFYPKSMIELRVGFLDQTHEQDGDEFQGVIYTLSGKHITTSGRSSFRLAIDSKVLPSTFAGADFTEALIIRYRSRHNITTRIMADISAHFETDTIGDNRTDSIQEFAVRGSYTPTDVLPLRFIRRKRKKPPRKQRPRFRIDAGIRSRSRTSDDPEYEYDQITLFAGASVVY